MAVQCSFKIMFLLEKYYYKCSETKTALREMLQKAISLHPRQTSDIQASKVAALEIDVFLKKDLWLFIYTS